MGQTSGRTDLGSTPLLEAPAGAKSLRELRHLPRQPQRSITRIRLGTRYAWQCSQRLIQHAGSAAIVERAEDHGRVVRIVGVDEKRPGVDGERLDSAALALDDERIIPGRNQYPSVGPCINTGEGREVHVGTSRRLEP